MKLKNRVCIVTGSSRGIGKAVALGMAKEGAKVVVVARTEQEGESRLPGNIHQTVQEVKTAGGEAIACKCDVSSEEEVDSLVKTVLSTYGRIDALVNNAGVILHTNIVDTPARRWDLIMRVNLRGPFLTCKAVLPHMMEQRSGSIVNMTSGASHSRQPGGVHYGVTKAGLDRFSLGLAEEVREYNIAVNSLNPGPIKTEGALYTYPADFDWSGWKSPTTVAPAAIFLALADAHFTGKVVDAQRFRIDWP